MPHPLLNNKLWSPATSSDHRLAARHRLSQDYTKCFVDARENEHITPTHPISHLSPIQETDKATDIRQPQLSRQMFQSLTLCSITADHQLERAINPCAQERRCVQEMVHSFLIAQECDS